MLLSTNSSSSPDISYGRYIAILRSCPFIVPACLPAGQFDHVINEDILLPFIGLFAFLNSLILDIFLESYHKRVTAAVPSVSSGQRKYRETLSSFLFDFGGSTHFVCSNIRILLSEETIQPSFFLSPPSPIKIFPGTHVLRPGRRSAWQAHRAVFRLRRRGMECRF